MSHAHDLPSEDHALVSPDGVREKLGAAIGRMLAPLAARVAKLRAARVFHAEGLSFDGTLAPIEDSPFADAARELGHTVIARLSPALWRKGREWPDVLGIALRCHRGHWKGPAAHPGDQDLLFATIRSPFTMPLAPLTTSQHDFLANRFWAVAPFALPDGRRVELRLSPRAHEQLDGSRADRIRKAVAAGEARFVLEARKTLTLTWHPIATVDLTREHDVDEEKLRYDAEHAGAGFQPVGVVHAMRRAVYAASRTV